MRAAEPWYRRVLVENSREIIASATAALLFTICVALWHYITGARFEWHTIHPIEEPTLTIRLLSALVFVSLGRLLYALKFYYILYFLFVIILRDRWLYNRLKKIIWYGLMALMGFVIVPWIIDVLNSIVSFFYNIFLLVVYLLPPLFIAALIFCAGWYALKSYLKS